MFKPTKLLKLVEPKSSTSWDTFKENTREIDHTPSDDYSTTTGNPTIGEPNSSTDIMNENGDVKKRRWFRPNMRATRDVDYTNHSRPKYHPEVHREM